MSIATFIREMRTDIKAAYKSEDTEEFFDRIFTKPLGYLCARFFIKIGWTPNMVTLLSMVIGFAGGVLFYFNNFFLNLLGVLLLIFANILDSTDGQIARLTGNKSTLGRILDALSTVVWYVAIYIALSLRLMGEPMPFSERSWGWLIWLVTLPCAFLGHQKQCMMADYYRNIHLFFLKNRNGDELDSYEELTKTRSQLPWRKGSRFRKIYLYFYGFYTYSQEAATPNMQRLLKAARSGVDEKTKKDYLEKSRKYIQLTNILTFNTRAYTLFLCVLLGVPFLSFMIELIVLGLLNRFMCEKYEHIAKDVIIENKLPSYDEPFESKKNYNTLFFLLGLAGVIMLVARTDLSQVDWSGTVLKTWPSWLSAMLLIWLVIYMLHALAYAVIIGSDAKKISYLHLLKMTVSGFALNNVTPVSFAGGEPYRIMELKPYIGGERAASTAFTFTIMNAFSLILLYFMGALSYIVTGCKGGILSLLVAAVVLVGTGFIIYFYIKKASSGLILPGLKLLGCIPILGKHINAFTERKVQSLKVIDEDMVAFHTRQRAFAVTCIIELIARLLEAFEFFVLLKIIGADVSCIYCIAAYSAASLIGNLLFFIPMQVGSREAGLALLLGWSGVASSMSITASLLSRLCEIMYLGIGVLIIMIKNNKASPTKEQK